MDFDIKPDVKPFTMLKITLTAIKVTSKGKNPFIDTPSIFIIKLKVSSKPPLYSPDKISFISFVMPPS